MDTVNHPGHYTRGKVETIDLIDFITNRIPKITNSMSVAVYIGNAIKYISRAPFKGNEDEDCKKAQWYIQRAIANGSHLTTYLQGNEINWFEMATFHMKEWQQNVLFLIATNQWRHASIQLAAWIGREKKVQPELPGIGPDTIGTHFQAFDDGNCTIVTNASDTPT